MMIDRDDTKDDNAIVCAVLTHRNIQGVWGSLPLPARLVPPLHKVARPRVPAAVGRPGRARGWAGQEGEGGL